jgi:hypothetical protein
MKLRLLPMNILVKFQPDIPILMVMGGRLTSYGPKFGVPVRSSEKGENYDAQLQTHQTLKLSWSTHNKNVMV